MHGGKYPSSGLRNKKANRTRPLYREQSGPPYQPLDRVSPQWSQVPTNPGS